MSTERINDGGPAFPVIETEPRDVGVPGGDCTTIADTYSSGGMTLRDYFAAKAMQSFMHGAVLPPGFDAAERLSFAGMRAYEMADAMLRAREVKP